MTKTRYNTKVVFFHFFSFGQKNNNHPVITIPYWDAFGKGYIITVCMPLVFQDEFVGTACTDADVVNLLTDTTIHG